VERPFRVATFAVPLSGNKGSASMLLGLRDAFHDSQIEVRFAVFSYYPDRDATIARSMPDVDLLPGHPRDLAFRLIPGILLQRIAPRITSHRLGTSIETLCESDVVLLVGGTTFADSMLYKVAWNVLAAVPAYLLRRPVVFVSQTMGPMNRRVNRLAARWTLKRAVEVHGRGRTSTEYARSLGIERCEYRPDLSFTLHVPDFDSVAKQVPLVARFSELLEKGGREAIGIAPNSIVLAKAQKVEIDYVEFLADAARAIHNQGYLPVLIPHSYRADVDPSQSHNNDRSLCSQVMERLKDDIPCFYLDEDLDSGQLRAVISRLRILVASRFHSMISALSVGVPPLVYGWGDQKYSEVLDEFGLSEFYNSYREIDASEFPRRLAALDSRRDQVAQSIELTLPGVIEESARLPRDLVKTVVT